MKISKAPLPLFTRLVTSGKSQLGYSNLTDSDKCSRPSLKLWEFETIEAKGVRKIEAMGVRKIEAMRDRKIEAMGVQKNRG
jgi:hypothetical protein